MKQKMKNKNKVTKGLYTTAVVGGMLLAPYLADEMGIQVNNVFENKASALEGVGTFESPYMVYNEEDLRAAMELVTTKEKKFVYLGADINLTKGWNPIGTTSKPAFVEFVGNGHTISGLSSNIYSDYAGLFGVMKDSYVGDVVIESPVVSAYNYVGVIAGKAIDSTFSDITVINPKVTGHEKYAGGIVGQATTGFLITNVVVKGGSVEAYEGHVGGLIGDANGSYSTNWMSASEIYVNTSVSSEAGDYVGGVFGELTNSGSTIPKLAGMIVDGSVTGVDYVGGVGGKISKVSTTSTFTYNSVSGGTNVGGVAGYVTGDIRLNAFVFNSSITSSTGKYAGIVFGRTGTSSIKTMYGAAYGNRYKYTSLNKEHADTYIDEKDVNSIFKLDNSSSIKFLMGGDVQLFTDYYYDVKTGKVALISHDSDEDVINSFASSEYQNIFNNTIEDTIRLLKDGHTWSDISNYNSSTRSYADDSLADLVYKMDTEENKVRIHNLFADYAAAIAAINMMANDYKIGYAYDIPDIFVSQRVGSEFLNSANGSAYINNIIQQYENGTYPVTVEKTAMVNAFKALQASPTQTNYNAFVKADKLDTTKATGDDALTAIAEYYKKANNLSDYVDTTIKDATDAVVKVETTPNEQNLTDARSKVALVTDATIKKELTARLDAVEALVEATKAISAATAAVTKAEGSKSQTDVNEARTLVSALPSGTDKTNLTTRLDTVQNSINVAIATTAVTKAEGSKVQADVNTAKTLVNALPSGTEKTNLTNRLNTVQKAIDDATAIATATTAVVKAEGSKVQADVDDARTLVNALPSGTDKTTLTTRLDTVQKAIDDEIIEKAIYWVEYAETHRVQSAVTNGRIMLFGVPDEIRKGLEKRLDAVQKEIDDKIAAEPATAAVTKAEGSKLQTDVNTARTLVNALSDGAIKTALEERLNTVQAAIDLATQIATATTAVVKAEGSKSQTDVDAARTLVNALADGSEKTNLTNRLNTVQTAIDLVTQIATATTAVAKAEGSKTQADVDSAKTLVDALPSGAEKTNLTNRLNAVQKAIDDAKVVANATNAVAKAEGSKTQADVDSAKALVNALPDGAEKTALTKRVDSVQKAINDAKTEAEKQQAITNATTAVAKAEGSKAQADVDDARILVNALSDGVEKTALEGRLDAVQAEIDNAKAEAEKQKAIEEATKAVVKAEGSKSQVDADSAKTLVNALPDGSEKTNLTNRLNAVQQEIADAKAEAEKQQAIVTATTAVTKAEGSKKQADVDSAKTLVNALPNGTEKTALTERLNVVQKVINDAKEPKPEVDIAILLATKAVERAEKSTFAKDIESARKQVNQLNEGEVKTNLTERLGAIVEYDSAYEPAKKLVLTMEKVNNERNINIAQNAVNNVKNKVNKAELQARIDAVKAELNKKALETTTKLVVGAENAKTSISVINAQKAIDELVASDEKTALQVRLDVAKAEIQKTNEDLSKFVVDEDVLKAIDGIKNDADRNALKAWKEAVERGEKYFSGTMVRSVEKSIPSKVVLENPEYVLIVQQLNARYESLLLGGKEYSYVYQIMIRDAYNAVLKFEAKPSQNLKDEALKAIEAVNKVGNSENMFITVLKARVTNIQF